MEKKQEVVNKIIEILEQTDISQVYPNLYQRIKEWIDEIPTEKAHDGDLVSRRDAIEAINALPRWVIDNNGEFQPVDAQTESMIDPDDAVRAIENLPSIADSDITCKDCKWWSNQYNLKLGQGECILFKIYPKGDDHCKMAEKAERREK